MHAAGIEFNHAVFIRMTAQPDALVIGVILRALNHFEHGIKCVCAARQQPVGLVEVVVAVGRTDDDGQLGSVFGPILARS